MTPGAPVGKSPAWARRWAPLWDDISALLQHQDGGQVAGLWTHFLGAIVLDGEKPVPGPNPRFVVIDGQQRLTTLQLLLAAAANSLEQFGAGNDAALLRELVINNPRKAQGTDRLKVWPTNANRAAFTTVVAPDGPPAGHFNDPENLIDEAVEYFKARTAEYLTSSDEDAEEPPPPADGDGAAADPADHAGTSEVSAVDGAVDGPGMEVTARAERLRITLCDLLKIVSIALDADDNAQVIFETLNARGTPLLAFDLVKNAVFAQTNREDRDTDVLYEQIWRPQLDDVIPATELFATFRQKILGKASDAEALIHELCDDAKVMRSFDTPPAKTPEAEFFARLGPLDAGTVLPVVLLLFRSPEVTHERRRRALRILESWLTRRALIRLTAKNYNRLVPRLVAKIKADIEHADDALLAALSGGEGEISRWPGDDEFRDFLLHRDVYGWVSQPRLTMALAAVEASLYSNKVDVPEVSNDLSLEHMLPQTWEGKWALVDADGQPLEDEALEQATEHRQQRMHRLGNLTIVTAPLNSSMSNGSWTTKREGSQPPQQAAAQRPPRRPRNLGRERRRRAHRVARRSVRADLAEPRPGELDVEPS